MHQTRMSDLRGYTIGNVDPPLQLVYSVIDFNEVFPMSRLIKGYESVTNEKGRVAALP